MQAETTLQLSLKDNILIKSKLSTLFESYTSRSSNIASNIFSLLFIQSNATKMSPLKKDFHKTRGSFRGRIPCACSTRMYSRWYLLPSGAALRWARADTGVGTDRWTWWGREWWGSWVSWWSGGSLRSGDAWRSSLSHRSNWANWSGGSHTSARSGGSWPSWLWWWWGWWWWRWWWWWWRQTA